MCLVGHQAGAEGPTSVKKVSLLPCVLLPGHFLYQLYKPEVSAIKFFATCGISS